MRGGGGFHYVIVVAWGGQVVIFFSSLGGFLGAGTEEERLFSCPDLQFLFGNAGICPARNKKRGHLGQPGSCSPSPYL